MPQHCYEYRNTLAWFFDNFDHPRRLRLLYVAAMFANRVAYNQKGIGEVHPVPLQAPSGAECAQRRPAAGPRRDRDLALNGAEAIGWTQAYCDNVTDRAPLVQRIALSACRMGNDPHNQEIAQCMLMDFGKNRQPDRDKLLLAAA